MTRLALIPALVAALALPAQAAPVPEAMADALHTAREAYRQSLSLPVDPGTLAKRQGPAATAYDAAIATVARRVAEPTPQDPYLKRKALWVRPYAADVTRARLLEVFDRAQAMGVTEIYLETFYGGEVIYPAGPNGAFPSKFGAVDVAAAYAREAKRRNMKLYAWIHTLKWNAKAAPEDLVMDGWGKPATSTEGAYAFIVSPSSRAVRDRLNRLAAEIAATGHYQGLILDYIRYPIRLKEGDVDETPDPRNFWGYSDEAMAAFFTENPRWDTPAFRAFLKDNVLPDEKLRMTWLGVWKDWLASEVEDVIAGIRKTTRGQLELSMAFFPNYYFHPVDSRAQESARWMEHFDFINPMCYSYFLDTFPDPYGHYNINRELSVIEAALASYVSTERPTVVAALSEDAPGTALSAKYHHRPFPTQTAWLKGRKQEGAFPNLAGVAYFAYGWLFPESDKERREGR